MSMLPQRIIYISARFLSKSCIRDKITPLGVLSKKKSREIVDLDKVELKVETDAQRLVNYVCGTNLLQEGGEDIKIKPDSEYPSWLKEIGHPKPLEEMDPNSKDFWRKLKKYEVKEKAYINSILKTGSVHK